MDNAATHCTKPVPSERVAGGRSDVSFVDALVDPVNAFDDPWEVARHPRFAIDEKRTILLSWARDELVAEQVTSRLAPELQIRSRIDRVVDALAAFDASAAAEYRSAAAAVRAARPRFGC